MRFRARLVSAFATCCFFCVTLSAAEFDFFEPFPSGEESIRVEVQKCELLFARDAAELRAIVYKPHKIDMKMKTILTMGGEPIEIESGTTDLEFIDVWLAFYPEPYGARVRWWTGVGDEAMEFPTLYQSGDWHTLENGEPTVLQAPPDVLRHLYYSGPQVTPVDIAKFLVMDGLVDLEQETGVQMRMTREEPFRPRFVFENGRVSVEGIVSSMDVSLRGPELP